MMDKYLFLKRLLIGILTIHIEKNIPTVFLRFLGKKNPNQAKYHLRNTRYYQLSSDICSKEKLNHFYCCGPLSCLCIPDQTFMFDFEYMDEKDRTLPLTCHIPLMYPVVCAFCWE